MNPLLLMTTLSLVLFIVQFALAVVEQQCSISLCIPPTNFELFASKMKRATKLWAKSSRHKFSAPAPEYEKEIVSLMREAYRDGCPGVFCNYNISEGLSLLSDSLYFLFLINLFIFAT